MVDDVWAIDCVYRRHPMTIMSALAFCLRLVMLCDLPIVNTEWEIFV